MNYFSLLQISPFPISFTDRLFIVLIVLLALVLSIQIIFLLRANYLHKAKRCNSSKTDPLGLDLQIITYIVELLSNAKDNNSSLHTILDVLGHYYSLNYICILETLPSSNAGHITSEWYSDSSAPWDSRLLFSELDMSNISQHNKKHHSYFKANSLEEIRPLSETMYNMAKLHKITGLLECELKDAGTSNHYLIFSYKTIDRKWKQHEIDTLLLLTRILNIHLSNIYAQKKAKLLENTDTLTGCNNLITFTEEAHKILLANTKDTFILFYSDINKFKLFNEQYGYSEGDRIIIEFTNALRSIIEEEETFGRITCDKFVALFNYNDPKYFLGKIKALNDYMNTIMSPKNTPYRISIIIGLSIVDPSLSIPLNIDCANMARKSITNRHKSRYAFFNEAMKQELINQNEIEEQMELALENKEFHVYYQPKFNLQTNQFAGAEALVRWHHGTKGIIPPDKFIPIFEENQFILKLDFFVFETVCKHLHKLLDLGKEVKPVSVNFSRLHLNNKDMVDKLKHIIEQYDVPSDYLEIELTETAFQLDNNNMFTTLIQLHNMGLKISMDDFGSGLSSLNLLRTLPCDILKLDKDFFQQGASTEREQIVIKMIVQMAKGLNMVIISEGVETEEQAEFLKSIQCDLAQGYLYSKPIIEAEYEAHYYKV
ncbi:MAG: GGDEF domain-containing phosphodiesterase [bacterium]|nr:GGDEF domain-containing phosphodiesterase [bacterium]